MYAYSFSDNISTNNIVLFMFMPLNIKNAAGNTLWIEPSPASSTSCRPLSIIMGKETDVYLKDHYKLIEEERIQLRNNPLLFLVNGADVTMKVNIKTWMIDGKMRGILSGLGGHFVSYVHALGMKLWSWILHLQLIVVVKISRQFGIDYIPAK